MFLVGWIPMSGHAVEELKTDQSFVSSQGQCFMQVSKTLPTYSWNHNVLFSSILEPIPVERDYHKVKWPKVTNLEFWCGTKVQNTPWTNSQIPLGNEPMIMIILPCFFKQKMYIRKTNPPFLIGNFSGEGPAVLHSPLPEKATDTQRARLMACKSIGSPAIQPAAHLWQNRVRFSFHDTMDWGSGWLEFFSWICDTILLFQGILCQMSKV